MSMFTKLQQLPKLTNSEKEIVAYILEKPEKFLDSSAATIAAACYVSVPSLYRLCEKAGVSGLSDMKMRISTDLADYRTSNTALDFDYPIKAKESHDTISRILEEEYVETIRQTRVLLESSEMQKAISAMKNAKRISVFTSSANIYLAQNFRFQMQEIGVDVHVPIDEYESRMEASLLSEDDLGIIISVGGRGLMVHIAADILKKSGAKILLISSTEPHVLKKEADILLLLCSAENHYNKISSFSTRLSILYVLDNLYTGYFSEDYEDNVKKKLEIYEKLVDGTQSVYNRFKDWK